MEYNCLICATPTNSPHRGASRWQEINCSRCGNFALSNEAIFFIDDCQGRRLDKRRDYLSFCIRQQFDRNKTRIQITEQNLQTWFNQGQLPKPPEQAKNLIIWLGDQVGAGNRIAAYIEKSISELASIIGCECSREAVDFVINYLTQMRLLELDNSFRGPNVFGLRLSIPGWERFQDLQTRSLDSRVAFMAMQFSNEALDQIYRECFKPAVADAGFELRRLDERQGAGLIDDQLRVAIRTAKFVMADLSSANAGAYWEAGFAEGVGKPVIYLCEEEVWKHEDKTKRPHFDTNHLVTIIWSADNLAEVSAKITATIRNTFPSDAKMIQG